MIQRAITELNEQGGSSEEAISKFIEAEYEDLPFAHAALLTCHLQKLVIKGEIISTSANCYMLSFEDIYSLHKLKKENKRSKRCEQNRTYGRQRKFRRVQSQKQQKIEDSQEQNQVQQEMSERPEKQKQAEQRIGLIEKQKKQGDAELNGEKNEVEELRLKVVEEQIVVEQDWEGNEEHDQMQEQQNHQHKELDLQQSQAVSETIDVTVEKNYQAERNNQAEKSSEIMEAENQNERGDEVSKEQNEVGEIRLKVVEEQIESEQGRETDDVHDQMQEWQNQQRKELNLQQSQVLSETVGLTIEENYQEKGSNPGKKSEVTEAEYRKEREDEVIEEPYHKELESKKLAKINQTTNSESEVRDEQAQFPEIHFEEIVEHINPERQHFEGTEEEKRLQEQKMEVCCQIFDLRCSSFLLSSIFIASLFYSCSYDHSYSVIFLVK